MILTTLNELGMSAALEYEWHTKEEPLLWLADGLCGAVREHLIRSEHAHYLEDLRAAGVVDDLTYVSGG